MMKRRNDINNNCVLSPWYDFLNDFESGVKYYSLQKNFVFFRLVQIHGICRWQNKRDWKVKLCFRSVENIVFNPFPNIKF